MKHKVHYSKNNSFRTIKGSGIFGGITSQGQINMNFFTERVPIPKSIVFDVDENTGIASGEIERETLEGTYNEVQFGVVMDIATAKSTIKWLEEKIEQYENALKTK